MAETSYPFDSGPGAVVNEAQWSDMARLWRGDGVIREYTVGGYRCLVDADGSGMHVFVYGGIAWIQGFYYENSARLTLPIAAADADDRIDRVTLRLDTSANSIKAHVTKGTPSGSPVAPALATGPVLWDIPLALVDVASTATNIDAPDLTDVRLYADIDAATLDGHDSTYFLAASGLTKAAVDALNVDADTLDGHDSAYFVPAGTSGVWNNTSLDFPWVDYAGRDVQYMLDSFGLVHLEGRAHCTGSGTQSFPTTLFTLPVGYRPRRVVAFLGLWDDDAGNLHTVEVAVFTNGDVTVQLADVASVTPASDLNVELSGMTFST